MYMTISPTKKGSMPPEVTDEEVKRMIIDVLQLDSIDAVDLPAMVKRLPGILLQPEVFKIVRPAQDMVTVLENLLATSARIVSVVLTVMTDAANPIIDSLVDGDIKPRLIEASLSL